MKVFSYKTLTTQLNFNKLLWWEFSLSITKGNCRIAEANRHLWSLSVQPCSQQGQPELAAQDHLQPGFEYLQGWRLLSNSLHTTLTAQKLFLMFKWNFLYFSFCPLPLSCHWALLRRICFSLLYSFYQVFMHMGKVPLSLLMSGINSHCSLSLLLWDILQWLNTWASFSEDSVSITCPCCTGIRTGCFNIQNLYLSFVPCFLLH